MRTYALAIVADDDTGQVLSLDVDDLVMLQGLAARREPPM
jgi:hypothetical protein